MISDKIISATNLKGLSHKKAFEIIAETIV
jgi:hypothetical protein